MGVLDKMKNFIAPVDDDYDEEELEKEFPPVEEKPERNKETG